jgi:hypothetical protein
MQLVNLLNNDRPNKKEDIADLSWLTDRGSCTNSTGEFLFLRQSADRSKPLWFRTDALTRYKNHRYCEVDATNPLSCVLIFLDYDKKHVLTSTLFEIDNGNIMLIKAQDFLGIPQKERNHWRRYQIRDNLHLHA